MQPMYYIGLDVHKRTISYCVKDGSGTIPVLNIFFVNTFSHSRQPCSPIRRRTGRSSFRSRFLSTHHQSAAVVGSRIRFIYQ